MMTSVRFLLILAVGAIPALAAAQRCPAPARPVAADQMAGYVSFLRTAADTMQANRRTGRPVSARPEDQFIRIGKLQIEPHPRDALVLQFAPQGVHHRLHPRGPVTLGAHTGADGVVLAFDGGHRHGQLYRRSAPRREPATGERLPALPIPARVRGEGVTEWPRCTGAGRGTGPA